MAYSDVMNKVSQTKLDNLDLILSKLRQGDGGSPYTAPPKEDPDRKYVPAPSKPKLAQDPLSDLDPTEFGYFIAPDGNAYRQTDGVLHNPEPYEELIHGRLVPFGLAQMQINPQNVASLDYDFQGGVVTPRYFTPPRHRNQPFLHIRTKDITVEELFHFNNFIRSLGPGFDKVQRRTPMSIG